MSTAEYIRGRVTVSETGCWIFPTRSKNGYAYFSMGGKVVRAHRASYEEFRGPIPHGLHLDHLCRNRACVNPAHLEAVTNRVNLLRGQTLAAKNAAKTHCSQNHEFTIENTFINPNGSRKCRACDAERASARRRAKE